MNRSMAAWEGRHANELLAEWGPPRQVLDDGAGGKVFVYTNHTYLARDTAQTNGTITPYGAFSATTTYQPSGAYRMFWINSNGYVYRWAWRGI